jgi:hypothetical protein
MAGNSEEGQGPQRAVAPMMMMMMMMMMMEGLSEVKSRTSAGALYVGYFKSHGNIIFPKFRKLRPEFPNFPLRDSNV